MDAIPADNASPDACLEPTLSLDELINKWQNMKSRNKKVFFWEGKFDL